MWVVVEGGPRVEPVNLFMDPCGGGLNDENIEDNDLGHRDLSFAAAGGGQKGVDDLL